MILHGCASGVPGADFDKFPSGVPDPPELGELAIQWAAEEEVVAYLGVPFRPTIDGSTDLQVAGRSVEIRWVNGEETWLSYPTIEDFKTDIAIVTLPTTPDEPVGWMGWLDRERFLRLGRTVGSGDIGSGEGLFK